MGLRGDRNLFWRVRNERMGLSIFRSGKLIVNKLRRNKVYLIYFFFILLVLTKAKIDYHRQVTMNTNLSPY